MGLRVQFTGGNYGCPWPGKSRDDIKEANVLGKQHLLLCLLHRPVDLGNTCNSEDLGCHTFSTRIESLNHGVTVCDCQGLSKVTPGVTITWFLDLCSIFFFFQHFPPSEQQDQEDKQQKA